MLVERVSRTESVSADYWTVDRRYFQKTAVVHGDPRYQTATEREVHEYRLGGDGELFIEYWEEVEDFTVGKGNGVYIPPSGVRRQLTERDVILLDHWPWNYHRHKGRETVDRNDLLGNRLRYHAKGDGLFKTLGELLR